MVITFRAAHASRHLTGTGLSTEAVESTIVAAIEEGVETASAIGPFWGRVDVRGYAIEFRAFPTVEDEETINVGTYYLAFTP